MKDKFIKLHSSENNSPVIVNVDSIAQVLFSHETTSTGHSKNVSVIITEKKASLAPFNVNENIEMIFNMLPDDVFVKFHSYENNAAIVLRKESIVAVETCKKYNLKKTIIYFNSDISMNSLVINENPDKVFESLNSKNEISKNNSILNKTKDKANGINSIIQK